MCWLELVPERPQHDPRGGFAAMSRRRIRLRQWRQDEHFASRYGRLCRIQALFRSDLANRKASN